MDNLILLAVSVLLLRGGLAMYVGGLSRAKNAAAAVARVVADLGIAVICAFVIGGVVLGLGRAEGIAAAFSHLTGLSFPRDVAVFTLLATVATGIVVGPVAERSRFGVIVVAAAVLSAVALPVFHHWQLGWLGHGLDGLNLIDNAGGAGIHVMGGTVALVAALLVGSRGNKYHRDGSASVIPGHSVPLAGIGALLLLAGLTGVAAARAGDLGGPAGVLAALNTVLAAGAGATASLLVAHVRFGKPDVLLLLTGLLAGAVSVAAGAVMLPVWAIVIGGVAGVLAPFAAIQIDLRLRIDDPTGAIAIHLVGGAWGTLATGIFYGESFQATLRQVGVQALGLAIAAGVAGAVGLVSFKMLGDSLRVREDAEFDGLDLSEHDIGAYPDFQQNSIRSYHLREA